jgi:NAD(P)-dependent dehydrogenase (short-subunit alcohol dehydrogenase family)
MEPPDLAQKNVILTGASGGLGVHLARALSRRGANLLLTARSEKALSALARDLSALTGPGQSFEPLAADLDDPAAPRKIVDRAEELWGRVDVLINNAACQGPIGTLWENPRPEWLATLRVDFLAPVELCREVLPRMIESRRGKIINLSGGGAAGPRPRFSAYAAAKAALVRFSETLALEVREFNVQVNCVAPGALNTGLQRSILKAGPSRAGAREFAQAAGQAALPESAADRAARLCCFLASAAGDGITGRLISAVWDPWEGLENLGEELASTDIYTLRRIVPRDRGREWS